MVRILVRLGVDSVTSGLQQIHTIVIPDTASPRLVWVDLETVLVSIVTVHKREFIVPYTLIVWNQHMIFLHLLQLKLLNIISFIRDLFFNCSLPLDTPLRRDRSIGRHSEQGLVTLKILREKEGYLSLNHYTLEILRLWNSDNLQLVRVFGGRGCIVSVCASILTLRITGLGGTLRALGLCCYSNRPSTSTETPRL